MIGLISVLIFCWILGDLMDRALFRGAHQNLLGNLGKSWALGLGTAGMLALLVDDLGLGVSLCSVGTASLVVMVGLVLLALRNKTAPSPVENRETLPIRILGWSLLAFAFLALGYAVYTGWIRPPYQFDALTRWMFKTKVLCLDGTLFGPLSLDPGYQFTHQRYPPLVSYISTLPSLLGDTFDDRIASSIYPWYAVALVLTVFGALKSRGSLLRGALAAAWIAGLPLIAFRDSAPPGSGAFSALADIPFTLFATCAALAALDGVERQRKGAFLEAGLMLAFAMLTKNEGIPLTAVTVLAVLVFAQEKRFRKGVIVLVIPLVLYYLLWARVARTFPMAEADYVNRLNMEALTQGLDRVIPVLQRILEEAFTFSNWDLIWPALLVLLVLSGRRALDRGGSLLLTIFTLQWGSYILAYTITAWTSPAAELYSRNGDPVYFLMETSLGRLFLHLTPIAVVLVLRKVPLRMRKDDAREG
ncbi:MAG: glycosyltransferase family 39 protein [Planctomycetes bacterium]|nr:glycosyltransferase family 39 protein [Planctomycetota bacterium]